MYTVVIVDDHKLLAHTLATMVDAFAKFRVLYTCENGKELIQRFENASTATEAIPDLVLMDIHMPQMDGIQTSYWIKETHPQVNVLALTVEEDEAMILQMLRAGAKGYLLKDTPINTLEQALAEVQQIGFYHRYAITQILLREIDPTKKEKELVLRTNEIRFIQEICTEKTYKEIAAQMCLSMKTIEGYRDSLFERLQIKNRIGLVMYALQHKIFVPK